MGERLINRGANGEPLIRVSAYGRRVALDLRGMYESAAQREDKTILRAFELHYQRLRATQRVLSGRRATAVNAGEELEGINAELTALTTDPSTSDNDRRRLTHLDKQINNLVNSLSHSNHTFPYHTASRVF